MTSNQEKIVQEIIKERQRQNEKWGANRTFAKVGQYVDNQRQIETPVESRRALGCYIMLAVLGEECGEVQRACLENNLEGMRAELVQVCAVAMAMIEMLDMDNAKTRTSNNNPASESEKIRLPSRNPHRDWLGEQVRLVWIEWARQQPNPKPSWLVPYVELSEADKEVDRRIGQLLYTLGYCQAIEEELEGEFR